MNFLITKKTYNCIYIINSDPDSINSTMVNSFKLLEKNGIMWINNYLYGCGQQQLMNTWLDQYKGQYKLLNSGHQLAILKE
jgi:hypothetical protein